MPVGAWKFLHLLSAFYFVGALTVSEWNGRALRGPADWPARAALAGVVRRALLFAALGALLLSGVAGNMLAVALGYSMSGDGWLHAANGVWLVMVAVLLALALPAASKLAAIAAAAAKGGPPDGWNAALARLRAANVVLAVLWLAMLGLMVFRWRS